MNNNILETTNDKEKIIKNYKRVLSDFCLSREKINLFENQAKELENEYDIKVLFRAYRKKALE